LHAAWIETENKISQSLKDCLNDEGCPSQTVFLVSVSGGADSMALLASLCSLSKQSIFNYKFSVLHVEHGIRPSKESKGDAEFVRAFCKENTNGVGRIPCRITHIPPGKIAAYAKRKGIGIEAAARHFRYKALLKTAQILASDLSGKTCICILTAHTKDDVLELALMRVLRGCGPAGLAAMTVKKEQKIKNKDQSENKIFIFRPMLDITRSDVIAYLTAKGISWREDATNSDEQFLRNRVRRKLIPLLNDTFPFWRKGVSAMAQTQSLAADFIAQEAENRIKWDTYLENSLCANAAVFFAQPQIIREEALFQAADELLKKVKTLRTIKRAAARRFCEGVVTASDLGAVRVRRKGESIILSCGKGDFFEKGVSRLIRHL